MSSEQRRARRMPSSVRVHIDRGSLMVTTSTIGVSVTGASLRIAPPPALGEQCDMTFELPTGASVRANGSCRTHAAANICGFQLEFRTESEREMWERFVNDEDDSGDLWRMMRRSEPSAPNAPAPRAAAKADDDDDWEVHGTATWVSQEGRVAVAATDSSRFHTVGETGAAYRMAFLKHSGQELAQSRFLAGDPAFAAKVEPLVARILPDDMYVRLEETSLGGPTQHASSALMARVVELKRGGYAGIIDGANGRGLLALGQGEMFLIERSGKRVFPFFSDDELKKISWDAVDKKRHGDAQPATAAQAGQAILDKVRRAQLASSNHKKRSYGAREMTFFPDVWVRVIEGAATMEGPTFLDGERVCCVAVRGSEPPRVLRLKQDANIELIAAPTDRTIDDFPQT